MLNRYWIVASVKRKVLSSYGWCSHFVGEPVTYAIFKDRRGVNPFCELKRRPAETVYGRLPSLNARPPSSLEGVGQGVIIRTPGETVKRLLQKNPDPWVRPAPAASPILTRAWRRGSSSCPSGRL
jgi:hypothetical protein